MTTQEHAILEFERYFGHPPSFVVRAPGRVNLIGEHTDYNDGFVLPIAIDRAVWIALRPTATQQVILHSLELKRSAEFLLENIKYENQEWVEYVKGIAWALQQAGYLLKGWEGLIASDIPVGAGLSSSAALELATARAFVAVSSYPWEAIKMAQIGQQAEREWVGVNCGIMDQMVSALGHAGHGLLIDCRSLKTELVPLPPDITVVVLDTATRRGLVDSAYNERRQQCKMAARFFGVPALRDVSQTEFDAKAEALDPVVFRRARHVIRENIRTLQAANAMSQKDAVKLGQLINASHVSLRDDFEVSSPELDQMVDCAQQESACYGARLTGAGFGGCAIALVHSSAVQNFTETVTINYRTATGLPPEIYVCTATDGATMTSI
jgi:galactokinase